MCIYIYIHITVDYRYVNLRSVSSRKRRATIRLKIEEWGFLSNPHSAPVTPDFELRPVTVPAPYQHLIESLVQVPRLRLVKALTGFTRIDSPGDYSDIADIDEAKRVKLAESEIDWVPALVFPKNPQP